MSKDPNKNMMILSAAERELIMQRRANEWQARHQEKMETIDRIWDEYLMDFDGHPNVALAVTSALRAAFEAGGRYERNSNNEK